MTGSLRLATPHKAPNMQAAPPMSALMASILAEGLMEIPPLSNVTPTNGRQYHKFVKYYNQKALLDFHA